MLDQKIKTCAYCGITENEFLMLRQVKDNMNLPGLTIDHVDPYGPDTDANKVWACVRCNLTKNHTFNFSEMCEIGLKYIRPVWKRVALAKIKQLQEGLLKGEILPL